MAYIALAAMFLQIWLRLQCRQQYLRCSIENYTTTDFDYQYSQRFCMMQTRIPEQDEDQILMKQKDSSEQLDGQPASTIEEEIRDMPCKYFIFCGLALLLIVILFYSSNIKIRVVYTEKYEGQKRREHGQASSNEFENADEIKASITQGKSEKGDPEISRKQTEDLEPTTYSFADQFKQMTNSQLEQQFENNESEDQIQQSASNSNEHLDAEQLRPKAIDQHAPQQSNNDDNKKEAVNVPPIPKKEKAETPPPIVKKEQQKANKQNDAQVIQKKAENVGEMNQILKRKIELMKQLKQLEQQGDKRNAQQKVQKKEETIAPSRQNRQNDAQQGNKQEHIVLPKPQPPQVKPDLDEREDHPEGRQLLNQQPRNDPNRNPQWMQNQDVNPNLPRKEVIPPNLQPAPPTPIQQTNKQNVRPQNTQLALPPVNKRADYVNPFQAGQFIIPKLLWTFVQNQKNSYFVGRCLENMKYFAKQSGFEFKIINSNNYRSYLPPLTSRKIAETITILEQRIKQQPKSNLKDHFDQIKQRLIMLHILNEKGGITVDKNVLFTQKFSWIEKLEQNMHINRGDGHVKGKYFAFFDLDHSSPLEKHSKSNIIYETEKYMIEFPGIEPYFQAAVVHSEFLTETIFEFIDLINNPASLPQKIKKYELSMGALKGSDLYYQILYISHHIVLQRKQQAINRADLNKDDNNFAIDSYGLLTMNERYFPKKLQFTFENNHEEKIYTNLAKYTLKELEETVGPLRYIVCMMFQQHINFSLQKAIEQTFSYYIHPDSFLAKYVILDNSQPFIIKEIEKSVANKEAKRWEKLPKIIWIYWDTGINNSTVGNKLCVDNIRRFAGRSKFEVREVNDSNVEDIIGKFLNNKIDTFIKNHKITTYAQTKSDFIRIAIIAKYGGIYMDASYLTVESLDWIVNIAQYPSEFIFNRFGELPRVLMLFHPHFGQPFEWGYDRVANTKDMWLVAYENNLLIAEPNQQIFWDWLDEYGRFITTPYEETEDVMRRYGVYAHKWTSKENLYLAAMDSIKNVIARKQRDILEKRRDPLYKGPRTAAEFYGVWSMSGYRGQQKFRAHTNFDNTNFLKPHNSDNIFLWRYPANYVQGIIGKVHHFVKLYSWNIKFLNQMLLRTFNSDFQSEVHPISFFKIHLYNPFWHTITKSGDHLELSALKK